MQRFNAADNTINADSSDTHGSAFALDDFCLMRDNGQPLLDLAQATFAAQRFTCLTGPSGSGKSSLLLALAGLNDRYSGQIRCFPAQGSRLQVITHGECAASMLLKYRRDIIGMVFQDPDLLVELTALGNASIAAAWAPPADRQRIDNQARQLLIDLGISQPGASAGKLSGGEQQRVAIARALAQQAPILLADEPTASLDAHNAQRALDVLLAHTVSKGRTLIVCSHDPLLMEQADHLWHLDNGMATCLR